MEVQALINYYAREGYFHQLVTACQDTLKGRPHEPVLLLWRGIGLVFEGLYTDAVRELEQLQGESDVELAALFALQHAHSHTDPADDAAAEAAEDRARRVESSAGDRALTQAALFFAHAGGAEATSRAVALVDRALRSAPSSPQALSLRAWLDLPASPASALERFEMALHAAPGGRDLESSLGRAHCLELRGAAPAALEALGDIASKYPWFVPVGALRARVLSAAGDWDAGLESAHAALAADAGSLGALRLTLLHALTRDGRPGVAAARLAELSTAITTQEPRSSSLLLATSRATSRLAGRDPVLMAGAARLLSAARLVSPTSAALATESAHQALLGGDAESAASLYRAASELDPLAEAPLYGGVSCQLAAGDAAGARAQWEFLGETFGASGGCEHIRLQLEADLAWALDGDADKQARLLNAAYDVHAGAMRGRAECSLEFVGDWDPEWIMALARGHLQHCGAAPRGPGEPPNAFLAKALRVLEPLAARAPGLAEGQALLARARFLAGDGPGALRVLAACVRASPARADLHVAMAAIHVHAGAARAASSCLEQAVAADFGVRDTPPYALLAARVFALDSKHEAAAAAAATALKLPGVRKASPGARVPLEERAAVYTLLAEQLAACGQVAESAKVLEDAKAEFRGGPAEVTVTLAAAKAAVARGAADEALLLLKMVPKTSPHRLAVVRAMADIHLHARNDKPAYARCYEEVAEAGRDAASYCLLGGAHMAVQDPERAIAAYRKALQLSPQDGALTSLLGGALAATHDYAEAVAYYEAAIRAEPHRTGLQLDLAALLLRLKRYGDAKARIDALLAAAGAGDPTPEGGDDGATGGRSTATGGDWAGAASARAAAYALLARVCDATGEVGGAATAREGARAAQAALLSAGDGAAFGMGGDARMAAADLCCDLGDAALAAKDATRAEALYAEAVRHAPGAPRALVALAQAHLVRGMPDAAQEQCAAALRASPGHPGATALLGELMAANGDAPAGVALHATILEGQPREYGSLAAIVSLLRRSGRLEEADRWIDAAERAAPRAASDPGLRYARGLLARYRNAPESALKLLNGARKDKVWGPHAVALMADIYLCPDGEPLWDAAALRAEALEAYTVMLARQPGPTADALRGVEDKLRGERDSVALMLAAAVGYTLIGQGAKARNAIKRVLKLPYTPAEAVDFERAWLFLADAHAAQGKLDAATDLCRKCLLHNASCARAHECLGQLLEREDAHAAAAEHYERAWKHENEASPAVGYRLAFNYLKAKRLVDAIDVCHKVLAAFPAYPGIRHDILDKARAGLRA